MPNFWGTDQQAESSLNIKRSTDDKRLTLHRIAQKSTELHRRAQKRVLGEGKLLFSTIGTKYK